MKKTVLVIGSGGREHALAWKLSVSPQVARIIVAPGNDAWPSAWERWSEFASAIQSNDFAALVSRAREAGVTLAVIGPDNPLAGGIVDAFSQAGIRAFGPTASAARIEASKAFAKEVMAAAGVPTAAYRVAHSFEEAQAMLAEVSWSNGKGWVVKADGLALGKGVRVCSTREEATQAARELLALGGTAGAQLVIEERLQGEEISWMAFCDGDRCSLLQPARDYKRLLEGNRGPNTGGMGAFSPVQGIPRGFAERLREQVFLPVLKEMKARGCPFRGILYAGLMADFSEDRYWVLEFNARFGDPEAQVLIPRMEIDLAAWCEASAAGSLAAFPPFVPFSREAAVIVVGAASGYPDAPEKDRELQVAPAMAANAAPRLIWAGVRKKDDRLVTAGGRVFGAVGFGATLKDAREEAYKTLSKISFPGMQYRSDIGVTG